MCFEQDMPPTTKSWWHPL